ncbi:MAG TPA: hypothetical protein VN625_00880 [Desulfuromonadaceae bacterium]|nr:hypothetical protein [Desulfuromonadaceae bacterium]
MDGDEREIFQYLKTWGGTYISAMEICRRAGGKNRFHDDPSWAKQTLVRMADRGILESDISGRYRIKPIAKKKEKQWVSPEVADAPETVEAEDKPQDAGVEEGFEIGDDEYYDNL